MARRDALRVGEDLGPHWKQSWLPLNADKRPTLIDCDVGVDEPVPVRSFFVEDPTAGQQGVRSMGELVKVWIRDRLRRLAVQPARGPLGVRLAKARPRGR